MTMFNVAESEQESGMPDVDDDGRVRSFRHERGNWAGYVYIKRNAFVI